MLRKEPKKVLTTGSRQLSKEKAAKLSPGRIFTFMGESDSEANGIGRNIVHFARVILGAHGEMAAHRFNGKIPDISKNDFDAAKALQVLRNGTDVDEILDLAHRLQSLIPNVRPVRTPKSYTFSARDVTPQTPLGKFHLRESKKRLTR